MFQKSTDNRQRAAVTAMCAGLGLTVLATVVPFTGTVLADHIRAGYPDYSADRVDESVTTYLVYLSVVGVLGVAGWLGTTAAVLAGKRWARGAATTLFVLGTTVALADLLITDGSGEPGLPALVGWAGMLPCVAGLLAVGFLWSGRGSGGRFPRAA